MGYSTDFSGRFKLDRKLAKEHADYIREFSRTRRMKRDEHLTAKRPDPVREAAGLPVGDEGEFFVGEDGYAGQDRGPDVIDGNREPSNQHGLWCHWDVSDDDQGIQWDGGEKFYNYKLWLTYYIKNFLDPWGYTLNGEIHWQGEDSEDKGTIICIQNKVTIHEGDSGVSALKSLAIASVADWEHYARPEFDGYY